MGATAHVGVDTLDGDNSNGPSVVIRQAPAPNLVWFQKGHQNATLGAIPMSLLPPTLGSPLPSPPQDHPD